MSGKRSFNAEGPCIPAEHYMIDALRGMDRQLLSLVDDKKFFVIHAARQSGKTTLLRGLARRIRAEGKYHALYCSLENVSRMEDASIGIPAIIDILNSSLIRYDIPDARSFGSGIDISSPYNALQDAFVAYCCALDKPLVVLLDEADCLSGDTLISFLSQLRNGYVNRAEVPFVNSLALVGMRNIQDLHNEYCISTQTLGNSIPFNIVADTMTLSNFTRDEIAGLYAQHTADTGQVFQEDAIDLVLEQTCGQPWLVNAIAKTIVKTITADTPQTLATAAMVSEAIQILILRNDAHFDSLMARLDEERVRKVIEPVIAGSDTYDRNSGDFKYVRDMGLIRTDRGAVEPANPIYGEIIVRTLSRNTQEDIGHDGNPYPIPRYVNDGVLDMGVLLRDFQVFWRENEAIWQKKYDYREAAPQLIMQAFLQRVVNGGGSISREMAAATGRVDLCVEYAGRRYPIELKIRRDGKTYAGGLEQTASYMDKLGCTEGWLVLFDQRQEPIWEEKLYVNTEKVGDKTITVIGC